MSIPVRYQGQLDEVTATFTAIEGHEVTEVTATCTYLAPDGVTYDVDLDPAEVVDDTATFTGSFRFPEGNATSAIWHERWETEGTIEGAVDRVLWVKRSAVVGAEEVASA